MGIFSDNLLNTYKQEFNKFDEPHEDISPLIEVLKGKKFDKVDDTQDRICPVCGNKMVKNFVSIKKAIQIDESYNCGSKFFDNGDI